METAAAAPEFPPQRVRRSHWIQRVVGLALMHADETQSLSRRNHVIGLRHAERGKDMLAKVDLERLTAYRFDRAAGPVDIDAVFPAVARVEHQRQPQRGELARARRRCAADFDIADQVW